MSRKDIKKQKMHVCYCDTCNKSYKNIRNLKRHIKEKHSFLEYWNCAEKECSSRFIRRSYLSKHLILKHKYGADLAKDAALRAKRGEKQDNEYDEDVGEDESIYSLLADRDENLEEIQFANTILDFDLTLLQRDGHFILCDKDEKETQVNDCEKNENDKNKESVNNKMIYEVEDVSYIQIIVWDKDKKKYKTNVN
jgi:hypothetical protein